MTAEEFNNTHTSKLNEQQREAVYATSGAVLLLAVPGSGKTTVLITRLGYMVCCLGINPENILTMTYTVAATKEMKERFSSIFGKQYANKLEFRTINGLSKKIIDYYVEYHGRKPAFPLIKDNEAIKIIGQIYLKINKEYPTESIIKDIRTSVTYIKNMMLLTTEEIEKLDFGIENMPKIYDQYCSTLKQQQRMDFDDQMLYAHTILKKHPDVLDYFQEKFRYICVDESQDTSKIQHAIIKLLAQKHGNIFMVGDEDQSIYGFRAAFPEALMNFKNDYPDAKILFMEKNYRSTDEIIAVANEFVSKNQSRYEKTIHATRGNGLPVQLIRTTSRVAQFKYMLATAKDCKEETVVLYRNNDSVLPLIDMLERSGVAYNCKTKDNSFFTHKVINDIRDIINFAYDQRDEDIFMRIYYKFGCPLKKEAAEYACEKSRKSGKTILEELIVYPELNKYTKETVIELYTLFPEILKDNAEMALVRIQHNLRYGIYLREKNLDAGKLDILSLLGKNEPTLRDLLRRLDELQSIMQNHEDNLNNKLMLSTIHSSKGLEYKRVYLLDIFDGILPTKNLSEIKDSDEECQYEEDRRLYYVAMTRAKDELYLFACADVCSSFTAEVLSSTPQEEIDENDIFAFMHNLCGRSYTDKIFGKGRIIAQNSENVLIEYENQKYQLISVSHMFENRDTTKKYITPTASNKQAPFTPFYNKTVRVAVNVKEGDRIEHKSLGMGTVLTIANDIVEIHFDKSNQRKRLSLNLCLKNGLLSAGYNK